MPQTPSEPSKPLALIPLRSEFQAALLAWYDEHRRDLPWRADSDSYSVWVSEIMLQQTTVAAVVPYFLRWMARFPNIESLAAAEEADVLAAWQGLGYYRRAKNLLLGARKIMADGMPIDAATWRAVPGVGAYTAGAIASIAHEEDCAAVDGNVERVFARLTANPATKGALNRAAWAWASTVVPAGAAREWNQALMELGATICRPQTPICSSCPVAKFCLAFQTDRVGEFPVPPPPKAWKDLHQCALVYQRDGEVALRQAVAGEWWSGLWTLPRVDLSEVGTAEKIGQIRHVLTRHKITLDIFVSADPPEIDVTWYPHAELEHLAIPAPDRKVLHIVSRECQPILRL